MDKEEPKLSLNKTWLIPYCWIWFIGLWIAFSLAFSTVAFSANVTFSKL